jgi:hypothetical protein
MGVSEGDEDRPKPCEQKLRQALIAYCEGGTSQAFADNMISGRVDYLDIASKGLPAAFSAYCFMRSTDRQERLMNDMHRESLRMEKQGKRMICLTWAIIALTAAIVALTALVAVPTVVDLCRGRRAVQAVELTGPSSLPVSRTAPPCATHPG